MVLTEGVQPDSGLSPPTRGSPPGRTERPVRDGSIPAHAGKPRRGSRTPPSPGVYPRPRGEALEETDAPGEPDGLSPPTRGSRSSGGFDSRPPRSIPAHAGKPSSLAYPKSATAVYPRPRGEAQVFVRSVRVSQGLSPPTRGSLGGLDRGEPLVRSIPAHAGKPGSRPHGSSPPGVYPRPRGEATLPVPANVVTSGLSPPTRGSPLAS